ncbi:MAG: protein kinase [Candidatus Dormibacteraeota bacterium]|nr:protein kinase [Candidatus Dormibacteraeota bacterium]
MSGAGEPPPPPPTATDLGIPGVVDAVEIGRGGFAVVYRARRTGFDQSVAVKVLAAALDNESRSRFDREVRAMGALFGHPFIVGIVTAGYTVADRPYIVMEDMTGGSLAARLRTSGPMTWQDATHIGDGLASALEAAHSAHVLHRDVKPENVLFSRYGAAKLADFGLAAFTEGPETRSSAIMVSLAHTAPEVLDGAPRTASTDVYGLASTIMTMIIGKPPFARGAGDTSGAVFKRIATEPPPDVRGLGVPDPVCRVLERALAKTPGQRYQTATEFRGDLERARSGAAVSAPEPPASDGERTEAWVPEPAPQPRPASTPTPQPRATAPPATRRSGPLTRNRAIAGGAGVVVLLIAVVVIVLATRGSNSPGKPTPTPLPATIAAAQVVNAHDPNRLAQALLAQGFVQSALPSGWSVTSTELNTNLLTGRIAWITEQLGGPAVSGMFTNYIVFANVAAAGSAFADEPPVPSGYQQMTPFTLSGVSDQSSCLLSRSTDSTNQSWATACTVLSGTVLTFVDVASATRQDTTDETITRTLAVAAVRNLITIANGTHAGAAATPPGTLSADGIFGQLFDTQIDSKLLPSGVSSGSPQSETLTSPPANFVGWIEIPLKGPDAGGDFIDYFVLQSAQDAQSWFGPNFGPSGGTKGQALDTTSFPSGSAVCADWTLTDSNNNGYGVSTCYVLYGNVVVDARTVGATGSTSGNAALALTLIHSALWTLDHLDGQ